MIEIENITKRYGKTLAVDRLNLTVRPGKIFGFIGPNGAGKTTTIKILGGLIRPDSGRVRICGIDMAESPEAAKMKIGFVPDRPYLYEKLTGMEFLRFTADLYRVDEKQLVQKSESLLDRFSLIDWKDELIEAYSHGMKQRLIMASAILHDPEIFIVDEPMVGLDPAGIRMVKELFVDLAGRGITFFISTHTLTVAEEICDIIGVINKGKLVAYGTNNDLKIRSGASAEDLESAFLAITREETFGPPVSGNDS
ncbi:MAG: ABC transporter ATP-binding protein [Deltaproteobacteria bacterium]|nr:ABC transporter ATP-binding protein [Deltaproteobacteria bacterium]